LVNGTQSLILGTSIGQDTLMDPYSAADERYYATALDVAALRDLGYAVATGVGLVALGRAVRRRRLRQR
jgi:hypothetical protein